MNDRPLPPLLATLLERINGEEALELEFKAAQGGLPGSLWETISAFANTNGGWLILGVRDEDKAIQGVPNASVQLQNLVASLRNVGKISHDPCGSNDVSLVPLGEKQLIVVRVPAAPRRLRPVYINGNPYGGTYVRRHAGDYRCAKPEVDRMMREASDVAADSTILPTFGWDDLDREALARYRRRFQTQQPGSPLNSYDDEEFLKAIGGVRRDRQTDQSGITVAGLLLVGKPEALREWRGRHLIDFRLQSSDTVEWDDRVPWDGHLLGAFETIYPRLIADLAVPLRVEGGRRIDESPVHVALREAFVNLLVHAE